MNWLNMYPSSSKNLRVYSASSVITCILCQISWSYYSIYYWYNFLIKFSIILLSFFSDFTFSTLLIRESFVVVQIADLKFFARNIRLEVPWIRGFTNWSVYIHISTMIKNPKIPERSNLIFLVGITSGSHLSFW